MRIWVDDFGDYVIPDGIPWVFRKDGWPDKRYKKRNLTFWSWLAKQRELAGYKL